MTGPLVEASWLLRHVGDPDVAVLDCRFRLTDPTAGRALYAAGHIPGAVFADVETELSGPRRAHGGRHPLPDAGALAARFGAWGIGSHTAVVAYDDMGFAARCWWLLRYLGHDHAGVLDGGLQAWLDAGGALTVEPASPSPRAFVPRMRHDMAAGLPEVRDAGAAGALVDVRAPERYRGASEPIDPVAGHIPGAMNVPWERLVSRSRWEAGEFLRAQFGALPPDRTPVLYCGSGLTACAAVLALEVAGRPGAKLYPGGWSDWVSHADHGVERG